MPARSDKLHPPGRPVQQSWRRDKGSCEIAIQSFLLRSRTLCLHRFIDEPAHSLGVPVIRIHFAFTHEERWRGFDSQRLGARLIELNVPSDLVAFHVAFKLMEIDSERFRMRVML